MMKSRHFTAVEVMKGIIKDEMGVCTPIAKGVDRSSSET